MLKSSLSTNAKSTVPDSLQMVSGVLLEIIKEEFSSGLSRLKWLNPLLKSTRESLTWHGLMTTKESWPLEMDLTPLEELSFGTLETTLEKFLGMLSSFSRKHQYFFYSMLSRNSCDFKPTRPYRLVTGSEDQLVNFYTGPPFKLEDVKRGHTRYPNQVAFAKDGSSFISVGADKKVGFSANLCALLNLRIDHCLRGKDWRTDERNRRRQWSLWRNHFFCVC
jgi:WD40 repeat protein